TYSPYDYLMRFRLSHAAWLLKNTSQMVQDIGFQSGFNDSFNFSTSFRKLFGTSPSQFRISKI
ncbi:MAG: helix-turn-helix transcriptional regulator, partial [Bacteroidales bacterium]